MSDDRAAGSFGRGVLPGLWAATLLVYVAGNGQVALWDRDESRYAQATVQMLHRGDWLVPYYLTYDQSGDPARPDPRFHKPPIVYWSQAVACHILGTDEFSLRLPDAMFGATAVVLVALLGRLLFDTRSGLIAALVTASAPLTVLMCKLCLCDAPLLCFTLAAILALVKQMRDGPTARHGWTMWAMLGLAILSKGPVTLLYFLSPVIGVAVLGRADERARLRAALVPLALPAGIPGPVRRPLQALAGPAVMLAIVAAWVVPVQIITNDWREPPSELYPQGRGGSFLNISLGTHVIKRAMQPLENHGAPPGYYVVLTAGLFFPWSVLVPGAVWEGLFRRRRTGGAVGAVISGSASPIVADSGADDTAKHDAGAAIGTASEATAESGPPARGDERWVTAMLAAWCVLPWVVLEVHATKLPHYFLPAIPALGLLVGRLLSREAADPAWWSGIRRVALRGTAAASTALALFGVAVAVAAKSGWDPVGSLGLDPGHKNVRKLADAWTAMTTAGPGMLWWMIGTAVVVPALGWPSVAATLRGRVVAGALMTAVGTAAAFAIIWAGAVPAVDAVTLPKRAAAWIKQNAPAGEVVLLPYVPDPYSEDGMVFYLDGRARRAPDEVTAARLLSGRPAVLVCEASHFPHLERRMGLTFRAAHTVEGYNYVKGVWLRLAIVRFPEDASRR